MFQLKCIVLERLIYELASVLQICMYQCQFHEGYINLCMKIKIILFGSIFKIVLFLNIIIPDTKHLLIPHKGINLNYARFSAKFQIILLSDVEKKTLRGKRSFTAVMTILKHIINLRVKKILKFCIFTYIYM